MSGTFICFKRFFENNGDLWLHQALDTQTCRVLVRIAGFDLFVGFVEKKNIKYC